MNKIIASLAVLLCLLVNVSTVSANSQIKSFELSSQLESRVNTDISKLIPANSYLLSVNVEIIENKAQQGNTEKNVQNVTKVEQAEVLLQAPKLPGLNRNVIQQKKVPQKSIPQPFSKPEKAEDSIRSINTTIILDESISLAKEKKIKNILIYKLNYTPQRGDQISVRRDSLIDADPIDESPSFFDNYKFYIALLAILIAGLILYLLLRTKKTNKEAAETKSEVLEDAPESPEKLLALKKDSLKRSRQELVKYSLSNSSKVKTILSQLNSNEQNIPILASCYQELGRSLFTSLYPDLESSIPLYIAYLTENPASYPILERHLSDLYLLLTTSNEYSFSDDVIKPFSFVDKLSVNQIHWLLDNESNLVKAMVFSQLPSAKVAELMKGLDKKEQTSVAIEISKLKDLPLKAYNEIAAVLAEKAQRVPDFENINTSGTKILIDILDGMNLKDQKSLLDKISEDSPETYIILKEKYYSFEDILRTPTSILSNALRTIDLQLLAYAISDLESEDQNYILTDFPVKLKTSVKSELETLGNVDENTIMNSKNNIVEKLRRAIENNIFTIKDLT